MSLDADPRSDDTRTRLTPSLLVQLRAGDPAAAVLLERLHRGELLRFCEGYLKNAADAQDAVQEVFYRVLKTPQVPDRFRPWLYRIARNHCLNLLRHRANNPADAALPSASKLPEAETGHLTRLVQEEARERLHEAVARLSDTQQEVLRLRYAENLSRQEIAEVLDLPESVVKSRLFEAVERLREQASL